MINVDEVKHKVLGGELIILSAGRFRATSVNDGQTWQLFDKLSPRGQVEGRAAAHNWVEEQRQAQVRASRS